MSLTSSRSRPSRADQRSLARYQRGLVITAIVATIVAIAALVGYALQGPRLREVGLDMIRVVAQPATTLRLESDRPLAPIDPSSVTITPAVPFSVDVQGALATIVFHGALAYDTPYTVTVDGVAGEGAAVSSRWVHEFHTAPATLRYLERGSPGEDDRIMAVGIDSDPPVELYRAPRIDAFVPVGSALFVVGHDGDKAIVELVEVLSGQVERLVIPADTRIDLLVAPASGTKVVFTLSSLDESGPYDRTLFVADTAGARSAREVRGLDGEPLRVTKAAVVPGAESVVAWVDDVDVVLIDLLTGLVLPVVTQAQEFWGVSSTGDEIVVVDVGGTVAVELGSLTEGRFPPGELAGRDVFEGQTHVMASGVRLQTIAVATNQGTDFTSLIVRNDGDGPLDVLYRTPGDLGSIGRFVVSPGDQYLAVEVIPDRSLAESDSRVLEPRARSVTTVVVDIATAEVVRSVEGFWPVW